MAVDRLQLRRGGSPLKISKKLIWDSGWSKSSIQFANFVVGFRGPRLQGAHVINMVSHSRQTFKKCSGGPNFNR